MTYVRQGSCNQCGECCKRHDGAFFLYPYGDICQYLDEDNKCKLRNAYEKNQKKPGWCPQEHWNYFLKECLPFPDPTNPAHWPVREDGSPKCVFPSSCSCVLVKV